jgi:dTDP-4-dehydrorhamnose reductase
MPTILITGANGQLGQALVRESARRPDWHFLLTDKENLDITDAAAVNAFFDDHKIDFCINAAGYTAVDRAEQEPELAAAVNVKGPRNLAEACQERHAVLFQLSTDYVYHDRQNTPFEEDDPVTPQSVYARTKWEGEQAAIHHCYGAVVVRTSWLYSPFGQNFLLTMLRLGREGKTPRVVYDQIGSPTSAADLAGALISMVGSIHAGNIAPETWRGIFNYSSEGVTSWYDFALAIFEMAKIPAVATPIRTADYPTQAVRPPYSVMSKEKIKSVFQLTIPHWRDSLNNCLQTIS